ncbi:MAG: glycosyltransferase [Oscillospiraceae bacterium]|nr:glycosyltransferase [Oscillospiraceae bacterium]
MARPQLSIGIIFKNEIRCLERCLKSLQPLRDAVPCEVVMADTGSTDGSYEIAAKYADILFDFPWINDFSAARNAVMDRCSGKWFLTVDADEWLDGDISELVELLTSLKRRKERVGAVMIRNYLTEQLERGGYTDFAGVRLVRMSSGIRYVGAIHEHIPLVDGVKCKLELSRTILHHDGYIASKAEWRTSKPERNRKILLEELEKDPEDLRLTFLYVESANGRPEQFDWIKKMMDLVITKKRNWSSYGPPAVRYAVREGDKKDAPETEEWAEMARTWFPHSYFTCIDVAYTMAHRCWKQESYEKCVEWCAIYGQAINEFRAGRGDMDGLLYSTVKLAGARNEHTMRILYGKALYRCGQEEKADTLLMQVDYSSMDNSQFVGCLNAFFELRAEKLIAALYDQVSMPEYIEAHGTGQKDLFLRESAAAFARQYRKKEEEAEDFTQYTYTLFAPLLGKCEIGAAAVIMQTEDVEEIGRLLGSVADWDHLPIAALEYALEKGVQFPPPGKMLALEEMDKLAGRLGRNAGLTGDLTLQTAGALPDQLSSLIWARGLAIVAVHSCDWEDAERGIALCRAFARIVGTFVSRYYKEEALRGDNFRMLPGMYRAAWYCQEAFQALDGGDCGSYIRLLREGVTAYPGTQKMAAFLLDNTPEVQELLAPSPEVRALADQVRVILARYEPNDPAVEALKQSEAYRKVAHLIEFNR